MDILRCPATRQLLTLAGDSLVSDDGRHTYPVVGGVPVLIDESRSIVRVQDVARSASSPDATSRAKRAVARLVPSSSLNVGVAGRVARFAQLVREAGGTRILIVGGGEVGAGTQPLLDASDLEVLLTDVYVSELVAVACDGHQLPFADASFDGVLIQAVLEHVVEPWKVVAEIHRVLKPAAPVYAETPFMQQVHEGAFDFTRFTELGHRRLFRMFEQVDRGVCVGPGTALTWSLRYFARSLPRESKLAASILDKVVRVAFFWLKHLDRRLNGHRGAGDAASGVYFLGRRADTPVEDRDLLMSYRGTMGSVAVTRGLSE